MSPAGYRPLRAWKAAAVIAGLLAACGIGADDEAGPVEVRNEEAIAATHAAVCSDVFGPDVDPATPLATVGGTVVTAGDAAVYLTLYPTLTTEQAVQDLVDIRAVSLLADDAPAADIHFAQARGRNLAWLRTHIWSAPELQQPDPARVEEFLTETRHLTTFGTPELATVTHVLFAAEEDEQTDERARNAEILAERLQAELSHLDRPVFGADLLRAAEELIPEDDPLLDGMVVYVDKTLTFPEEYSGSPRWYGLESVVPGFGEPSFASPIGVVVGPVRSVYGWHVLVVEERTPPDLPPPEEMRRIAETRTVREMQSRAFRDTMDELLEHVPVLTYEDTIQMLALPPDERLRREAEARGERFR